MSTNVKSTWRWQVEDRRPSWDEYFMMLAEVAATRATCDRGSSSVFMDRRGTGSVIVAANGRNISTGYNGSPPGEPHCDEYLCPSCGRVYEKLDMYCHSCSSDSSMKLVGGHVFGDLGGCIRTVHAEKNAILNAKFDLAGSTLYTVLSPCYDCSKDILAAGISRVAYLQEYRTGVPELLSKSPRCSVCKLYPYYAEDK